ncbi:hypothetical protein SAMN05444003_1192 [Cognatiyoonia sediminum]|uniref:Uncharacterized protein n=1 Tax=Cognatiyoonia sediminum TaxID=1508389 RepID=A0A1M5N5D9_9RHOB|nr:hypothetical protein SAMN05444003_1192 [Cognatiyoonia sediminum]
MAHSLPVSRDRLKLLGPDTEPTTNFSNILGVVRSTADLFDRIVSHWEYHIENSQDVLRIQTNYAKMYFAALPDFSKTEDPTLMD